jgi:hypothetical protein
MRDERFVKPTGPDWITGEAGRQRMVTDRALKRLRKLISEP